MKLNQIIEQIWILSTAGQPLGQVVAEIVCHLMGNGPPCAPTLAYAAMNCTSNVVKPTSWWLDTVGVTRGPCPAKSGALAPVGHLVHAPGCTRLSVAVARPEVWSGWPAYDHGTLARP